MNGKRTLPRQRPAEKKKTAAKKNRPPGRAGRAKARSPRRDPAVEKGYERLFELAKEKGMPFFPFGPPVLDE